MIYFNDSNNEISDTGTLLKIDRLLAFAIFFLGINVHAAYILIHEESYYEILLKGGTVKKVLRFKIGQYDDAIKFADANGFPAQFRTAQFTFGFDEELDIKLTSEMSERFLALLKTPAKRALNYTPSTEILDPTTGKKCTPVPTAIPCANIFNFITLGIKDTSGRGFQVVSSDVIDNLLTASENGILKTGDVVLFRNNLTRHIGNVMLYIGNAVLMGWDGDCFFFQSIPQATEYWERLFPNTVEISREVLPLSNFVELLGAIRLDCNSTAPNITAPNIKYDPAMLPLDTNNLPSYIK